MSDNDTRKRVELRLVPKEYELLSKMAERRSLPLATLIRYLAMRAAREGAGDDD